MEIRMAAIGEEGKVVELVNDLIKELGGPPLSVAQAESTVRSFISGELDGAVIVASINNDLVGVCTLTFQPAIRTLGKYGIIQEMYVAPEFRSGKLGTRLVETAKSVSNKIGCPILELSTPPDGERAENFYCGVGFGQVGVRMRHNFE